MPGLVDLGLVERREIPPSSQFRLIREDVAAQAIIDLARSRDTALDRIGAAAAALPFPPVSVIVFGSFARGEADEQSDLDAIVVRPDDVDEELRRLLPLKTEAEYEPDDVAPGVATKALERAQRCVAVARTVAAGST
jgi:predicted nucleotidyltransferase